MKIMLIKIEEAISEDNITEITDAWANPSDDEEMMENALSEFGFEGCGKTIEGIKQLAGYIQARDLLQEVRTEIEKWLEDN